MRLLIEAFGRARGSHESIAAPFGALAGQSQARLLVANRPGPAASTPDSERLRTWNVGRGQDLQFAPAERKVKAAAGSNAPKRVAMPISEDFKPMAGKASFELPTGRLEIPADERVSIPLLNAALQCGLYLDHVLAAVRGVRHKNDEIYASDLTTLYFAARIHGVTAAGSLLAAHGLGREAVHMERSQYEFFLKMLYYDHKRQKAIDFVDSIPKSAMAFADRGKFAWSYSEEELKEIGALPDAEPDFVSMRDHLLRDSRFTRQFSSNPIIKGFLANARASFRNHWLYASSVLHASNLDMTNVIVDKDGDLIINVDSRNKHPNRSIADFGQRAFVTAIYVSVHFGSEIGNDVTALAERLQDAVHPHLDEPGSVRSIHDA
jgi:hypothetical protein